MYTKMYFTVLLLKNMSLINTVAVLILCNLMSCNYNHFILHGPCLQKLYNCSRYLIFGLNYLPTDMPTEYLLHGGTAVQNNIPIHCLGH